MPRFLLLLLLLLSACTTTPTAPPEDLHEWLKDLPGAQIKELEPRADFPEAYEVRLTQPLDHDDPDAGTFEQRIYLSHKDYAVPMLIETEGYAANRNYTKELSRILNANQIIVEHRYFGKSKPDPVVWKFLTVEQAANDHHRVIELFKEIYSGPWIASGTSKGGQTALYHRYFFPNDVEVTVPYVAPIPLAVEDPRIYQFLNTVGDEETRKKIKRFQAVLLERRDEILPLFREYSEEKNYTYSIGEEAGFEYAVLEYSFSFWQWHKSDNAAIPADDAPAEEVFEHFRTVVPFYYFTAKGIETFEPFYYQACTELGYYGFQTDHLDGLLKAVPHPTNTSFAPKGVDVIYRPEVMADIHAWLVKEGNRILYLYGELDTWTACAVNPEPSANAVKVVNPGGAHTFFINDLKEKEKERVYSTLEKWLDVRIEREPSTP